MSTTTEVSAEEPVLEVTDLSIEYRGERRTVRAVDNVSFHIGAGEIFGLAGESGCGKSTVAHSIMRLLRDPAVITSGSIRVRGRDVLAMDPAELRVLPVEPGRDGVPVRDERPQPGDDGRRPDRRHLHHPPAPVEGRVEGAGRGAPRARAHRPGSPGLLSAPALGRDAPAGGHRDGGGPAPEPADHGRAHDRPRRRRPAGDHGSDRRAAAGARILGAVHHPRHVADDRAVEPDGRHVRRPVRGDRRVPGDACRAAAPLHPRAHRRLPPVERTPRPAQGPRRRRPVHQHPGPPRGAPRPLGRAGSWPASGSLQGGHP